MRLLFISLIIFSSCTLFAQKDSTDVKRLDFTGDFRFRVEHDWNSINANGDLRTDRSRLRYRMRFGLRYQLDQVSSFGARIRSGNINDQQGPHLTIGGNNGEFGLSQIGFEKLYYQFSSKKFKAWIGKNDMPLRKMNELFWNDNVFPEGIGLQYIGLKNKEKALNQFGINAGHFIINSRNGSFFNDAYLQIIQLDFKLLDERLSIFPGYYFFHQIGNFPDQQHEFLLDYKIFHLGGEYIISQKSKLRLSAELYMNLQDYTDQEGITDAFVDQKEGVVISAKYGQLKKKGDFIVDLYLANLQQYSIVDYFAQNDWARWDYSSINASGSRLSNFRGFELRLGYAFKERFNLILRAYQVDQLVAIGTSRENGSRIRLDLNIGF